MLLAFDISAAVFDRNDLRVLRRSYNLALTALEVDRVMDRNAKEELAKLVFNLGRGRMKTGFGLRAAQTDEAIAAEARDFLREAHPIAICA